jgi:DNA-binding beta-propeller fold protein YncE
MLLSSTFAFADGILYYADIFNPDMSYGSIRRVNTDGTGLVTLIDVGGGLRGMDVDVAGGKLYWSDVNNYVIARANLDGTNPENLVTTGLEFASDVAVHGPSNRLYWGDQVANYIGVANLDGSNPQLLIEVPFHRGLTVDPVNEKLYWSTSDTMFKGRIQRCNLDGTNMQTVVSSQQSEFKPASIAIDPDGGKIYWTDYVVDVVRRSNLDGTEIEDLWYAGANFNPRGITLDVAAGKVYWGQDLAFSGPDGVIKRMNLDGGDPHTAIPDLGLPQDLTFVSTGAPCPGDLDGDGEIGQSDLGVLLGDFGCESGGSGDCDGDIDGDGDTDQADLGVLLSRFGGPCP